MTEAAQAFNPIIEVSEEPLFWKFLNWGENQRQRVQFQRMDFFRLRKILFVYAIDWGNRIRVHTVVQGSITAEASQVRDSHGLKKLELLLYSCSTEAASHQDTHKYTQVHASTQTDGLCVNSVFRTFKSGQRRWHWSGDESTPRVSRTEGLGE